LLEINHDYKTRTDDSHATPFVLVRFSADHQIKTHAPPFVKVPDFSFKFQSCDRTPQAEYLTR